MKIALLILLISFPRIAFTQTLSVAMLEARYAEHLKLQPITENAPKRKHPGLGLMITGGAMTVGGCALFLHSMSMRYGANMALLGAMSTAAGLVVLIAGACVVDANSNNEVVLWQTNKGAIRLANEGVGIACVF